LKPAKLFNIISVLNINVMASAVIKLI